MIACALITIWKPGSRSKRPITDMGKALEGTLWNYVRSHAEQGEAVPAGTEQVGFEDFERCPDEHNDKAFQEVEESATGHIMREFNSYPLI